jgi:hypothetical protein
MTPLPLPLMLFLPQIFLGTAMAPPIAKRVLAYQAEQKKLQAEADAQAAAAATAEGQPGSGSGSDATGGQVAVVVTTGEVEGEKPQRPQQTLQLEHQFTEDSARDPSETSSLPSQQQQQQVGASSGSGGEVQLQKVVVQQQNQQQQQALPPPAQA